MRLGEWVRVNLAGKKIKMHSIISDDEVEKARGTNIRADRIVVANSEMTSGNFADDAGIAYSGAGAYVSSSLGGRN